MPMPVLNLCAVGLMVFACIRPVGYFLEQTNLLRTGQAYLISPLPMPFRDIGPYENYTQSREYRITFLSGVTEQFTESRDWHKRVGGVHRYKIAVAHPIEAGRTLPETIRHPIYEHLFCQSDFFSPASVSQINITQFDKRSGYQTDEITYICLTS